MTDRRLPSKAALAQVRARYAHESSDDPATWRSPSDAPEIEQALRIDLSRCIEVLEHTSWIYETCCRSSLELRGLKPGAGSPVCHHDKARTLLRELHSEGDGV